MFAFILFFYYSHFVNILFKFFEHASFNRVLGISKTTFGGLTVF